MMSKTVNDDRIGGIFRCATPTPEILRLWLQIARTTLGWSPQKAAEVAGVGIDDIARLEASGESRSEEDDDILCGLASTYQKALHDGAEAFNSALVEREIRAVVDALDYYADGLRGDWNLPLARCLRRRRAELGLSLSDVEARTGGVFSAVEFAAAEWDGAATLDDWHEDMRAVAKALELPFLELRLLAESGQITEEDIDEWNRWRAERDATAYRRAK